MLYDDVLQVIGEFGLYQKKIFAVLCYQPFISGLLLLISTFTLNTPEHRCAIPGLENDTFHPQDDHHRDLINQSIPQNSKCLLRNQSADELGNMTSSEYKCTSWVYDTSTFTNTLVTEFNLVCDDASLKSTAVMTLFLGLLIGYGIGNIADYVGRKPMIVLGNFLVCISSYLLVWSPNYTFVSVVRFFLGFGIANQALSVYNVGLEIVGPSKRIYTGVISNFTWLLGMFAISLLGYLIRTWRYLHLSVAIFTTVLLTFVCIVPESPRWLLTRGKTDRAKLIIEKMAACNKVKLLDDIVDVTTVPPDTVTKIRFWKMFTSPALLVRTLVMYLNWFTVSIVYFGIMLNLDTLVGNVYLNLFLTGIFEGVAYLLVLFIGDKVGRRILAFGSLFISGLCLMSVIFILMYASSDQQWLMTLFTMVGLCGSNVAFCLFWLWTGEFYPTELRNFGTGTSSCMARLASVIAPYFGITGDFKEAAPFIIYSAFSFTSLVLTFVFLPETANVRLPDTIYDCKMLGKK
ncbi:hypothetical protein LOTGIDRAFT_131365 [Lottia gigantea]|uniref:Major facilitator superfamily (MFS) profile domain-containing protein n=1 Tax=Lottia gigantea TaxID=225164 RepID=V4B854_LOTGI|nr:hypothetical protein LOTGIDRAFT_131365 [Lottia gigantea]ESO84854.1 hypothetical protein LOTGIDRAFT_131365 [Lottia gigantea]